MTDLAVLEEQIAAGREAELALQAHWRSVCGLPGPVSFDLAYRAPPKANMHKVARRGRGRRRTIVNDLTGVLAKQEESFAIRALAQLTLADRDHLPLDGPLAVGVTFTYKVTPSWSAWQQEAALRGTFRMTKTPDIDNLLKFVWDSVEKVLITDDKNICHYDWLEKRYGPEERIAITLRPMPQATAANWKDLPL